MGKSEGAQSSVAAAAPGKELFVSARLWAFRGRDRERRRAWPRVCERRPCDTGQLGRRGREVASCLSGNFRRGLRKGRGRAGCSSRLESLGRTRGTLGRVYVDGERVTAVLVGGRVDAGLEKLVELGVGGAGTRPALSWAV